MLPWVVSAVALVCVVALVAGGVFWWPARDSADADQQPLLAGQLTGLFPTTPSAAWQVSAAQLGGEQFISPDPAAGQYGSLGSVHDGSTLLALVGSRSQIEGRTLVGVNTETGQHWSSPSPVKGCADAIVGHRIACYDNSTVTIFDTQTGAVTASAPTSLPNAYAIGFNGSAAFLRGFTSGAVSIAKLDLAGAPVWTKQYTLGDQLPGGDGSSFTATASLVASAQSSVVVASADDGHEILNRAGSYQLHPMPDGSIAVVVGTRGASGIEYGPVVVVRPDGSLVEIPGSSVAVPQVVAPDLAGYVVVDGKLTSVEDRTSTWTTTVGSGSQGQNASPAVLLADSRETVMHQSSGSVVAVDTATGQQRWTAPAAGGYSASDAWGVTDGTHVIVAGAGGAVNALTLEQGSAAWSLPSAAIGNTADGSAARVLASGGNLVTMTASSITGFAPTGGRATVPGAATQPADAGSTEGTVTHCQTPPKFTPQQFRTTAAGLVVTMKVIATCADGDVMSGTGTRITIADGGALVASGTFDFSRAPAAIPSSDAGAGISMELTYPPGSFFRTPDTLGQVGGTAAGNFTVECDPGPQSSTGSLPAPKGDATAPPQVATGVAIPPGTNLGTTTGDALRVQADSDRAFILANLNNHWVAQLSAKQPGLNADGRIWDNQAILDEFLALRLRFNDVRLLYSTEWSVFSRPGWWVSVAALTFPGPEAANAWCSSQGFDADHCFAKLISTTASPDSSTRYR